MNIHGGDTLFYRVALFLVTPQEMVNRPERALFSRKKSSFQGLLFFHPAIITNFDPLAKGKVQTEKER